ncbi:hypothetical protein HPB51_026414 [Rhipicephalus microplus]|uniref:Uncharacterized protein n=1 Tax=Rhipicephalus microplus TaxID=6941 RepID=A0A9J6D3E5_RHIMP|nr:hypothetical protein HPB51_026414 [Rhipicephalus microplus]
MSLWSWDDEWFVRRTYLAALEHVQPHAIAFLGDLFSEPPELSNETRQLRERFWSVFAPLNESTFPASTTEIAVWTRAMTGKDFAPSNFTTHFHPSDFITSTSYTDIVTGKVIEVPLELRRLRPGTVSSIFAGCPTYILNTKVAREGPEGKRARMA